MSSRVDLSDWTEDVRAEENAPSIRVGKTLRTFSLWLITVSLVVLVCGLAADFIPIESDWGHKLRAIVVRGGAIGFASAFVFTLIAGRYLTLKVG